MSIDKACNELSYQAHRDHLKSYGLDKLFNLLENKESIVYWRHERMLNLLNPFLDKGDKWLTVGDGLGSDAN